MSWQLGSVLVLSIALAIGFGWYERSRPPARVLALVAALAALAAIGRVAFAAFPNVKPTTDIVLFSGYAIGGPAGFAVGAIAALVSNVFLGQGPWTPWQMAAWGVVGLGGAALGRARGRREPGRVMLVVAAAIAGFGFGAIMDAYQWSLAAEHTLASYLAVSGTSLGFNIAHAAGNVAFALLIGPAFVRALTRYRRRFEIEWRPSTPALASVVLALMIGAGAGSPATAQAARPPADVAPAIAHGVRYLEASQNRDGGFGAAQLQSSDSYFAGWAALGLGAAGRNPLDVVLAGRSVIGYLRAHAHDLTASQDYERALLVLRVAGINPRRFAGRDLVARLLQKQRGDGSFDGLTDRTAFAVLALRGAGFSRRSKPVRAAVSWLLHIRNPDGSYGNAPAAKSDIDDTAAVLQALVAGGRRGPAAKRAATWLLRSQNGDGGFSLYRGGTSNSQSTSYAVLGLAAAGHAPRTIKNRGRTPFGFLTSMQASDGSFRYSRDSAQTPVWVTAQVVLALEGRPLPLRAAPRRKAHAGTTRLQTPRRPAAANRSGAPSPVGSLKKGGSRPRRAATTRDGSGRGALAGASAPTGPTGPTGGARAPAGATGATGATGPAGAATAMRLPASSAEVRTAARPSQPGTGSDGSSPLPWLAAIAALAAVAAFAFRGAIRRQWARAQKPG